MNIKKFKAIIYDKIITIYYSVFIPKDMEENKSSIRSQYRPEIDGLRAFAVIAVITYHFNKEILPNGYLGVDIFFVISGFVITSSLYNRPSKNFKDFISGFYERRIKRLVPALAIFVLTMSLTICFFNPEPGLSLVTGLTSLFGVSNLYLTLLSKNYFGMSSELNVFTNTWSLGVEEQFYILFPLLIWFSGFGRQTKNGARNLFLIIGGLAITSLIGFIYFYQINQTAAYFSMPTRFWEMASGCLIFIAFQKRRSIEQLFGTVPPILLLLLIIGVMFLPSSLATASTLAVVVLSAVLIASLKKGTGAFIFFTHPKIVYIGLISYSLYLWHWGVITISRWTIGIHWWSIPFQVALMLGLAIASFKYIETPLRTGSWFGKRWKTFVLGGGLIITLSGVLISLGRPLKGQLFLGQKIGSISPKLLQGKKCLENTSIQTYCYLIDNKSEKTLWMLGDSHGIALSLAGEKLANSLGMNLKLFGAGGTGFPPLKKYDKSTKRAELQRLDEIRLVEQELYKQKKVGDIVLITMYLPFHFGGTYSRNTPSEFVYIRQDGSFGSQENYFSDWTSSIINLAKIAQKKGVKVIIQTPTPEWEEEGLNKSCTQNEWFNISRKRNCQIASNFFIDDEVGLYKHIFERLNQLSKSHENIYLFNTYKIACPGNTCNFIMDGVEIYADSNHLSYGWSRDFLAPEMYKFINEIQATD